MNSALVIDDNSIDRKIIAKTLQSIYPRLAIRFAADPYEARQKMFECRPSFVLLDNDMPRMTGSEFLGHLRRCDSITVIIVSGQVIKGRDEWKKLKLLGAADVLCKPQSPTDLGRFREELSNAIHYSCPFVIEDEEDETPVAAARPSQNRQPEAINSSNSKQIIALGASTGGPRALREIISQLPDDGPPVLIAQHISEPFVDSLVSRLDKCCQAKVQIAKHGERIVRGNVYVASPAGHIEVSHPGRIEFQRRRHHDDISPSVDTLFHSLAKLRSRTVFAALLTGMGDDGAAGLAAIRAAGGRTIAQDEETCVVYGMPARAIELDAAETTLPIDKIYSQIIDWQSASHTEPQPNSPVIAPNRSGQVPVASTIN